LNLSISITIPDADVTRYQTAIVAQLDPAGNSGLTPAQLVKQYVATTLKAIVQQHEWKKAETDIKAAKPADIAIT